MTTNPLRDKIASQIEAAKEAQIEGTKEAGLHERVEGLRDALAILDAQAPQADHTDLSWAREICDDPDKLDAFMEAYPLLESQVAPDAVAEADEWNTIGAGAVGHLREMYRPAYDALGSSGRTSLRNWINTRVDRALASQDKEAGE